jgi:hypothetical protein
MSSEYKAVETQQVSCLWAKPLAHESEREGEAPTALLVEGATRAPDKGGAI